MLHFLASLTSTYSAPATSVIVGDVRVSALSPTLLRVEPKGPRGFEDAATFSIVGRSSFAGVPLTTLNVTSKGTALGAGDDFVVLLRNGTSSQPSCAAPASGFDVSNPQRSDAFPNGVAAADRDACC